ncbi:MAG: RluA family pseudouridine synthase [Candidatus Gygaella obscura]|nr:RluA family pseudouridine synthase [Candidatus Gygaella obscura]
MLKTIKIVFEDRYMAVFYKPADLIVNANNKERSLTDIINKELERSSCEKYYPCHRLDKQTSGLILYAKGKEIRDQLMNLFRKRQIKKSYVAFLHGSLKKSRISINDKIDGKESISIVKVKFQKKKFAIVELIPLTGRKNQLRIHCKKIYHPIVGERKFIFAKDYDLRFKRLALHAYKLAFKHPVNKKMISLEIGLPNEMKEFIKSN